ncbi:MAG: carboxypeptidase-like regulatory domain-containing protein, partial [Bacteroidales bacterium]|nr:carboxypeptidase-like regulatory domain-containing protein [Bacteroidales bacterium]
MLRKISILTLLLLISCAFNADLLAQENNFKGQILDIESKQGVPFATLSYVIEGSGYGATSDFEGNFTIDIHQDIDSIMISHLAYSPVYFKVANLKKKNTKIYLKPLANQIQEIVITAKKEKYSNKNNPAV